MKLSTSTFDTLPDERKVTCFELSSGSGLSISIINLGGIVTSVRAPDRLGCLADVVLGFASAKPYLEISPYFGAIIGRYGNRIARGRFQLDDRSYELACNNGPNHLHGGLTGLDKVLWAAEPFSSDSGVGVELSHVSADGDEGYPGTLAVRVRYELRANNDLVITYRAETDQPTLVNLTNHSYFNLTGDPRLSVLDHRLTLPASHYLPVDESLIPTGELAPVAGTPFDFRSERRVGEAIDADHEQLRFGGGYDHCWAYDDASGDLKFGGRVTDPESGRVLTVHTTEPGVQFYTANNLDGTIRGKGGVAYGARSALCLETQHFPDSPNKPEFPPTVLRPGEEYFSRTVYSFGVQAEQGRT